MDNIQPSDVEKGFLVVGIMIVAVILIIRWFIRGIKKSYRARWWNKIVNSRSINMWVLLTAHFCMEPMSKDIRGKKFNEIDWEAMKEKHTLTPTTKFKSKVTNTIIKALAADGIEFSQDAVDTINQIFYHEIDECLADLDRQIVYISECWIKDPTGVDMCGGLTREFETMYANHEFTMEMGDLHMFGYRVRKCLDEVARQEKLDAGFRGELSREEQEESYEEESYEEDSYYEPVVHEVHHHHETPGNDQGGGFSWGNTSQPSSQPSSQPERKPAARPTPPPKPKPQPKFEVQRLDRGSRWQTKGTFNNLRQAEQQMRNFQSGAYRTQDENQPNVQWRVVGNDGYEL